MSNVTGIHTATNNALMITPTQCLDEVKEQLGKEGYENVKKVLIITLDDSDDQFRVGLTQAGMSMSECLSLCDITKTIIKGEMGYYD